MTDSGGPIRVLHVDDETAFAEVTAEFLERTADRFEVTIATSATEGLEYLHSREVDCIVSDYEMPGTDGLEFLERVREIDADLPFILFTGKGSEEIASEAVSAGVTDYLQKETGAEQYELLANRIRDAVEHQYAQTAYREVFENVPVGIVIHDQSDGSFVDMNVRYAELFGYERDELLEAGFEAIHPHDPPYTVENARLRIQQASEAEAKTFEWVGVTKHGERFQAEVHLTSIRLHGRDRILAAVRDGSASDNN